MLKVELIGLNEKLNTAGIQERRRQSLNQAEPEKRPQRLHKRGEAGKHSLL